MDAMDVEPDFSKGAAWVRGRYVPIADAAIPLTDWGFLRSDAAYDVVTVWDGAFFRLDAHLQRSLRVARTSAWIRGAAARRWRRSWRSACACRASGARTWR